MWISRRKADALEKRIADLELQVQSQQEKLETFRNLWIERQKFLSEIESEASLELAKPILLAGLVLSSRSTDVSKKYSIQE